MELRKLGSFIILKVQARADIAEFEQQVYAIEDEMSI